MGMRFLGVVLLTAAILSPVSAQQPPRRDTRPPVASSLLDEARELALGSLADLPDFIADQTIRRALVAGGQWRPRDILETTVSFNRKTGETVQLLSIDGVPTLKTYQEVGGTTAIGTFSSQMTAPFQPSAKGKFTEVGRETYRGRDCVLYRFRVLKADSVYELKAAVEGAEPQRMFIGYSGRMWIDRDTRRILRVELLADDIPPDFLMSHSEVTVDYDWVTISGERYWMPISAEALAEFRSYGQTFVNLTQFRNYRKFDGDVKVVD